MFNLYYRPFLPGFRVRPQQEVPGFDINDENSAVPSASRGRPDAPAFEADLHGNLRRARCAKQTVDKGLRSDAPLLYRRCMRECMAEGGYIDYLSPPNLR
jgi:hypothetical protein